MNYHFSFDFINAQIAIQFGKLENKLEQDCEVSIAHWCRLLAFGSREWGFNPGKGEIFSSLVYKSSYMHIDLVK